MSEENQSVHQDPDHEFNALFEEASAQSTAPAQAAPAAQPSQDENSADPNATGEPAPVQPAQSTAPAQAAPAMQSSQDENSADPGKDIADLERRAHGYDSMLGRLEAERTKRKELEARLAEVEAQAQKLSTPKPDPVQIPENLRDDIKELHKRDPRLAALVQEDSEDGRKMVRLLEEYGAEYAAERGETILLRRDFDDRLGRVQHQTQHQAQQSARQSFFAAVGARHQDWVEVAADPMRAHEHQAYMDGLRSWAKSRPYEEGAKAFQIMERGTPAEVIWLLDQYKESTGKRQNAAAKAADAMAIPSRPGLPPTRTQAPKDDFDAAFNEALGQ